jgi:hypothetical protein
VLLFKNIFEIAPVQNCGSCKIGKCKHAEVMFRLLTHPRLLDLAGSPAAISIQRRCRSLRITKIEETRRGSCQEFAAQALRQFS